MKLEKLRNYSRDVKGKTIAIRLTQQEYKIALVRAKKLTGGNLSDFIRHAIINWSPEYEQREDRDLCKVG